MPALYRILMYSFPIYLVGIEYILRLASKVDPREFMGPTLSAVGLGLLIPLLVPKTPGGISTDVIRRAKARGTRVVSEADHNFIAFVYQLILFALVVWAYDLYLNLSKSELALFGVSLCLLIGLAMYLVGVLMSEIKEMLR